LIVEQYENGMTPEELVRAYDTLTLPDAYGAIAFYLRYPDEVRTYLAHRQNQARALQESVESEGSRLSRSDLLARRCSVEEVDAPAG
jgi:hypothetical protein